MTAHLEAQLILLHAQRIAVTHQSLNRQGLRVRRDISVIAITVNGLKAFEKNENNNIGFPQ